MKTLSSSGYVFAFERGAYSPDGKVEGQPNAEQIEAHNLAVAASELAAMKASGRGVLYLAPDAAGNWFASQWAGGLKLPVSNVRRSWHNMAGREGRTDCDFHFDGSRWHGVNIGDSQLLRVRRCKR